MSRKINTSLAKIFADGRDENTLGAGPVPYLRDTLMPFADSVPWPVIVVNDAGIVTSTAAREVVVLRKGRKLTLRLAGG